MTQDNEQAIGNLAAAAPAEPLPHSTASDFAGSYLELMFGTIDHAARARTSE